MARSAAQLHRLGGSDSGQLALGLEGLQSVNPLRNNAPICASVANQPTQTCIFCRHADPAVNTVVSQRKTMYARLDNFPASPGHIEIVPFRHVTSFFDLTNAESKDFHALARWAYQFLALHYKPDGYTIGVNDGAAAGQTIEHLHVHVIPRHNGDVADARGGIRRIFPNCNPDNWR